MQRRTVILTLALAMALAATGALAQHEHHQDQASTPAAGNMDNMMMGHQEIAKLVDQLAASFAGIESEKDPAVLNEKLAAHGILLKQLQAKMQSHSPMMGGMMKDGGMKSGQPKH